MFTKRKKLFTINNKRRHATISVIFLDVSKAFYQISYVLLFGELLYKMFSRDYIQNFGLLLLPSGH